MLERYESICSLGNKENVLLMEDYKLNCRVVRKSVSNPVCELYKKLAQKSFPYITEVTDCSSINGKFYIYEKFIDGRTIQNIVDEDGIIPAEQAVKYTKQILEGLSHVHSIKIIHRDITPNNLILDYKDNIHIIDFGISREYKPNKSKDTTFYGTQGFASPEHYGFAQTDERSDLFSVGKVLQFMLTGDLEKAVKEPWLQSIIEKATKMEKSERYRSALEMKQALMPRTSGQTSKTGYASSFPLFDESDKSSKIVNSLVEYMKSQGIQFKRINLTDSSPYAIMPSLSSVGYRRKEGIVIFASRDKFDKMNFEAVMGKHFLDNSSDSSRPYKFVFTKEEFPQAVKCLAMNPDNCP